MGYRHGGRYRQRYLDLMRESEGERDFFSSAPGDSKDPGIFTQHDFIEWRSPMFHPIPVCDRQTFKTHHNALTWKLYMRVAPELFLKRLVIGGLERIYEINRCFRNEGISHPNTILNSPC